MKYNFQPRLKIYHNILGKFDLIDKFNNPQSAFCNSINIKVSWHFNEWNNTYLSKLLFKEFYLQQRFNYKKTSKRIKNIFFEVTLRKTFVFLYLESLLHSYFLKTNIKYKIDVNFVPTTLFLLTIRCQNDFFNYYDNFQIQFSNVNNILKFNSITSLKQILVSFNYYFLPSYTI